MKRMNISILFLVFLLAITPIVFAPPPPSAPYLEVFPPILRDWGPLTLLVTFTIIIFYGGVMAIAHGFNQRELGMHAKAEILQAFATLFIVVFMVVILDSITDPDLMRGIIGGEVPCGGRTILIDDIPAAMDLIKCKLSEKANTLANMQESAYSSSSGVSRLLSLSNSIYGIPVFQGNWVTSWYKEFENYRVIYNLTTSLLISLNAQIKFVDYVSSNMLVFFLPVGIILRAFYFSRSIGAFFISIAFGLYFIYPVIFTITDPGFVRLPPPPPAADIQSQQTNFCYPTFSGSTVLVTSTGSSGGAAGGFGLDMRSAANIISKTQFDVILRPIIVLGITLVLVRYMIFIFGGEPYEIMRYVAKVV